MLDRRSVMLFPLLAAACAGTPEPVQPIEIASPTRFIGQTTPLEVSVEAPDGDLRALDVFFEQATRNDLIPDWIMTENQASLMRFIFMGLALMLLMIYRPQGIFGDRRELAIDGR